MIRRLNAQRCRVFIHGGYEAIGERRNRLAIFNSTLDDLVVDIGDVTNIRDIKATASQPTLHHVEHHHHARMTEMTVVIHRHTADVHPHLARIDGSKRHFVTRKRVVNFERTHEQYGLGNERN